MSRYNKRRDRIVKPPSAKQKATAKRYNRFRTVTSAADANPSRSWWVGLDRAQLRAAAADEQNRIAYSRCGRVNDPKYPG